MNLDGEDQKYLGLINRLTLMDSEDDDETRRPFKVVNCSREVRLGLTASTLIDLIAKSKIKFQLDQDQFVKVVLEADGTEIDDNDYFNTLEPDTTLMILVEDEKWTPYRNYLTLGLALDPPDETTQSGKGSGSNTEPTSPVEELVWKLHQDLSFFPWLTPKELDTIAKMDRDEMKKIVPDEKFLEFLSDLCERYLQDKDKANSSQNGDVLNILHDPIKLIRTYSKYNYELNLSFDQQKQRIRRTN